MLKNIFAWFSNDLAIDLGTANTLVYVKGRGVVCNEPSVVVMRRDNKKIVAIGAEAKKMLGKTPSEIVAVRPLKDGVIADFDATEQMLKYFIKRVHNRRSFISPRIVIGVSSGITQVEQKAVKDTAQASGASKVYLVREPIVAALGAGLPIGEPTGSMIVDVGGGTTEIAVISLGGVVCNKTIKVGGDKMDEAIIGYVKRHHNLMIGDRTAEQVKIEIGSAYKTDDNERTMEVTGRDLFSGMPKRITINESEIREALNEPINAIIDTVKVNFENTPPELGADIVERGIVLAGGGALLRGLDSLIRDTIGLPVILAEDPLTAVVRGVGKVLDELDLKKVAIE